MRKPTRTLGIVFIIALFTIGLSVAVGEEKEAPKNPLPGTWELIRMKYGPATEFSNFPKERRRLKLITDTHWSWVEYDTVGKKEVKMGAGGVYVLKDDIYTETMEFATGEYMLALLDKKHAFKVRVEGDKWFVTGELNNGLKIEEIWQRVK